MKRLIALIIMTLLVSTTAFAANTAQQVDFLMSGSLQSDGSANAGGKVYTCDAGTVCGPSTSDPKTTWSDSGKVSASLNPVILDSNGKANIYADGLYKFQIYTSGDVLVETIDNVYYVVISTSVQVQATLTPSSQTIATTVDTYYCNAQSGAVTTDFTGVSAVGNTGKRFTFKKTDSTVNSCTIDVLSSQTIDGSTTAVLSNQYDDITIESDGTNWTIVSSSIVSTLNATIVNSTSMFTNTIGEKTSGVGVTIDSFKIIDNGIAPSSWPSFDATKDGAQANITGTQKVTFGTEVIDTNSDFGSSRFTPTAPGKYLLYAHIVWTSLTVNDKINLHIYKNGANLRVTDIADVPSTSWIQQITMIANANGTGDYFEIFAENDDRNTSSISDSATWFGGSRIAQ